MPTRPHHQRLDFDNGICELYCIIFEDDDAARIYREIAGIEFMADLYGKHETFQIEFCKNGELVSCYVVKLIGQCSSVLFAADDYRAIAWVTEQNLQRIAAELAEWLKDAPLSAACNAYAATCPELRYHLSVSPGRNH